MSDFIMYRAEIYTNASKWPVATYEDANDQRVFAFVMGFESAYYMYNDDEIFPRYYRNGEIISDTEAEIE